MLPVTDSICFGTPRGPDKRHGRGGEVYRGGRVSYELELSGKALLKQMDIELGLDNGVRCHRATKRRKVFVSGLHNG